MSAATTSAAAANVALCARSMLVPRVVTCIAYVALAVTRFVAVEVIEGLLSALRRGPVVAMSRVVSVIHVSVEAAWPMKPRACSDEQPATKPIRAIIAVGGAVVRSIIVIAVSTCGSFANIDRNLCGCHCRTAQKNCSKSRESECLPMSH